MVRRLVEQQQIRRGKQQTAERDAAALAAGERRDVTVAFGHAQRIHRVVDVLVELPCVRAVDRVLHLRLFGKQRVVVGVGLGECGEISLNRSSRSRSARTPSSTLPRTSFAGSSHGSCSRKPTLASGASSAEPDDGSSLPP